MKLLNSIRQSVLQNDGTITVTDLGEGSKIFASNERKIGAIAKIAGTSKKKAALLVRLISYFKPQHMLELGTSVGLGTSAMSIGHPEAKITTLEGCENTADIARQLFEKFNLDNIRLKIGEFEKILSNTLKHSTLDFVYFDGNHQKEATLTYFEQCTAHVHNDTVFVFDDIYWSEEMLLAWEEIKQHPQVTVSVDIYFWGIVFFRKEQAKQHFTIRCF